MSARVTVEELVAWLEQLCPPELSEDWDNTGLLLGSRSRAVDSVLTCLTLTGDVAREAVEVGAGLVVSHHPLLFRPVQRITSDTPAGRTLLLLLEAGIAVYSPHTSFDSAGRGINQQLAELLDLTDIQPLRAVPSSAGTHSASSTAEPGATAVAGSGRYGRLSQPCRLEELVERVGQLLPASGVQWAGPASLTVQHLGIACGAAAEYLSDAVRHGCQALLTGEARFHAALEAREQGVGLILAGHYATERPAIEQLAGAIQAAFPLLTVQPSQTETDPLKWN